MGGWGCLLWRGGRGGAGFRRVLPGLARGDVVSGVRAGARGWEGGGGLSVTPAYLWDRSPYQSLAAGT